MKRIYSFFEFINEAYPNEWNSEFFSGLSYEKSLKYAKKLGLITLGYGTGRYVFQIDNEKVLKIAKNEEGKYQNECEVKIFNNPKAPLSILAPIYNFDKNFNWIEMAFAQELTKPKFRSITGFTWDNFSNALHCKTAEIENFIPYQSKEKYNPKVKDLQLFKDVIRLGQDFNVPLGDLQYLRSYGIIKNDIVLIDYGADISFFKKFRI